MGSIWRRAASLASPSVTAAAATVVISLAAGLADPLGADASVVVVLLALAQTAAVTWLVLRSIDGTRQWATTGVVLAGGWVMTFLVPTWIYVFDPRLADGLPLADGIRISTAGLLSLIAGIELLTLAARNKSQPGKTRSGAPRTSIAAASLSLRWTVVWILVGLAAMGLLFALNGGPAEWLTNLDKVGAMAEGLTYIIGVALVLKHAAVAALAQRLQRLGRLDLPGIAFAGAAMLILIPLGARLFIAVLLVEILLLYALILRPPPMRFLLPIGLACALLLIFGYGSVKRYQTFRAANPALDQGFGSYARDRAVREAGAAYANNYFDGVRLTAQARDLVPSRVDYEAGEAFARLALQPIPSQIRPDLAREPALERVLGSRNGNRHAVPLQAEGYVQFGLPGVGILFALVGAVAAVLERALRRRTLALASLVTLVAVAVQLPFVLRTGIPLGVAVAGLDIIGTYAVARTVLGPEKKAATQPEETPVESEAVSIRANGGAP